MNHTTRTPARTTALALLIGLIPALAAPATAAGAPGFPVATFLRLPAQGVVSSSPCEAVPLAGEILLFVRATPINPGIPGAPLAAQVSLVGALFGRGASGTPYGAIAGPFQGTALYVPINPGAPISFLLRLYPVGPPQMPAGPPNAPINPGSPCPAQAATGTLSLTFNADGTVQAATVSVGSPASGVT